MARSLGCIVLLAAVTLFLSVDAQKITYGNSCSSDKDCTGPNEVCEFNTAVIPACTKGMCSCKQCHTFNAQTGCSNATVTKPGKACTGEASELLGQGASCVNKTVQCKDGFSVFKDKCGVADSCATGHSCGIGSCVNATCSCNSTTSLSAQASYYVSEVSAYNANRTLCLNKAVKQVNAKSMEACTSDPATNANQADTAVCGSGLLCYQCPEDKDAAGTLRLNGKCRQLNQTAAVKEFTCMAEEAGEAIPRELAPTPKTNIPYLGQCTDNDQCEDGNHTDCRTAGEFTPSCKKSICGCDDCYARVNGKCIKKRYLTKLNDTCNGSDEEVIKVNHARCFNKTISCMPYTILTDVVGEKWCMMPKTCNKTAPCALDMICGSDNKCTCPTGFLFNDFEQRCVAREYGDACEKDADCNQPTAGRSANGDLVGFTKANTGVCTNKRCACGTGYKAAVVGYMSPRLNDFFTKTVCVPSAATIDQGSGPCAVDPIKGDTSAKEPLPVCSSTHLCSSCPYDGDTLAKGMCRRAWTFLINSDDDCASGSTKAAVSSTMLFAVGLVMASFKYLL